MGVTPILVPEGDVVREIEEQRPPTPVGLLSRNERHRLVERGFVGLYRWYVARSQETRNWNPDLTFDWRNYRRDHSVEVHTIVEGFYAVEQYVPDYVTALLKVIRRSYGRSHFHLRWGAEEERHADMWRNAVLSGGLRSVTWLEGYEEGLRGREWGLPWDDPIHMLFYTVFQERATQVNYLNLGLVSRGESSYPGFASDKDPVLEHMCRTIAADEAAHYNFFLEGARLFLYYFPQESIEAMAEVVRHFGMPARELIPDYEAFGEVLHRTGVFGIRQHSRDVVRAALSQLGVSNLKALEEGIRRSREVPDELGSFRQTSLFETIDADFVEAKIHRLFHRVRQHEEKAGLSPMVLA